MKIIYIAWIKWKGIIGLLLTLKLTNPNSRYDIRLNAEIIKYGIRSCEAGRKNKNPIHTLFSEKIYIQKYINRSHGKQHVRGEVRWVNPKTGQRWTSPDLGRKNFIGQRPRSKSYSSIKGVSIDEDKTSNERLPWLYFKPYVQTTSRG